MLTVQLKEVNQTFVSDLRLGETFEFNGGVFMITTFPKCADMHSHPCLRFAVELSTGIITEVMKDILVKSINLNAVEV